MALVPSLAAMTAIHGLLAGGAMAAVQVDLDATVESVGPLASWSNTGAIGGTFSSAGTVVPEVALIDGVNAVVLTNDNDPDNDPNTPAVIDPNSTYYDGPNAFGTPLEGNNSRTVEMWVHDDELAAFQTVISWGKLGTKRAAAVHGVGTDPDGGAVIHWEDDAAYGRNKLVTDRWTHVAVVHTSGSPGTISTYVDGFLTREEPLGQGLAIESVYIDGGLFFIPIRVGRGTKNDGTTPETDAYAGVEPIKIGRIRVHDTALDQTTLRASVVADGASTFWPDSDSDGMPDWWENLYGLDPNSSADATTDLDSDGLNNLDEFNTNTEPDNNDTDGDGAWDGAEVAGTLNDLSTPTGYGATDPLIRDFDLDGLPDGAEATAGTDPYFEDTDLDGANDSQEVWFGTDPLTNDGNLPSPTRGPVIDFDATVLPVGPVTALTNNGVMGEDWVPFYPATPPSVQTHSTGVNALVIDSSDNALIGPAAPLHMALDGARSVEAWILNPVVGGEETVIAWGARGSPDGSNGSFIHGLSDSFGAFGNWGDDYDLGWEASIVQDQWSHVAYTYDAVTFELAAYRDGVLANSKIAGGDGGPLPLVTKLVDPAGDAYPFMVGAQNQLNGVPTKGASLIYGKLKVYDRKLSAAEILASYNADQASFPVVVPPGVGSPTLAIEYDADREPDIVIITWDWTQFPGGSVPTLETSTDLLTWQDTGEVFLITNEEIDLIPADPATPEVFDPTPRFYRINYTVPGP